MLIWISIHYSVEPFALLLCHLLACHLLIVMGFAIAYFLLYVDNDNCQQVSCKKNHVTQRFKNSSARASKDFNYEIPAATIDQKMQ
jgi:hypothetical protein